MTSESKAAAQASYRRCCASDQFPGFYQHFIASCPEVAPMFADTDMRRQEQLLRHAIGLLVNFPDDPGEEPTILTRIAERHSRRDLNVDPRLYEAFVDAIIVSVARFDPAFTPDLRRQWREAIDAGIEYMKETFAEPKN